MTMATSLLVFLLLASVVSGFPVKRADQGGWSGSTPARGSTVVTFSLDELFNGPVDPKLVFAPVATGGQNPNPNPPGPSPPGPSPPGPVGPPNPPGPVGPPNPPGPVGPPNPPGPSPPGPPSPPSPVGPPNPPGPSPPGPPSPPSPVGPPNPQGAAANRGAGWERFIPDGPNPTIPVSDLKDKFVTAAGLHDLGRVVANKEMAYVITGAQKPGKERTLYDPYSIGLVLGYLYELQQFGATGPPSGFTIEKTYWYKTPATIPPAPPAGRRRRREDRVGQGRLVFTRI